METLFLDGNSLTIDDVVRVASDPSLQVAINPTAIPSIEKSAAAVACFIATGQTAYGITTGFGAFKDRLISLTDVEKLQENILLSHAVGVGPGLEPAEVRAMMLIRANTLAKGHSGVRLSTLELLLALLNLNVLPVVPCKGSLGASGDLAPLAHMALPLIGKGMVDFQGKRLSTEEMFTLTGLRPIKLTAKEGLALTNGTSLMTALGTLAVREAENLYHTANVAAALTLEAQNGTQRAFDERIHLLRPQPWQLETAAEMRALLKCSQMTRPDTSTNVQDAYTLRCIPQVHGAVRNTIDYAQ
ncbi:MAG: aromatic amino acid lyase, partial [Anaerolineaceae bacterium]|nr:aromatic amino acid lyase [Anaerolineaceae bacterium]